ncbi:DNA oxidative demethylase AlkB [Cupriavidus gilardii]|uniref:DNA oxidative demethylase AlkB n=1 Tax=Cupriavidus gilardii TaxID=82541 RepID=UPI0018E6B4DF|nr:DNA oxidative demethylase AlkB [Cupriavidus gilardii]MCT9117373.1 DNA oxidative demethylase AlkB [Cupriavidus gilardii]QQE09252.1 DNA oxidative demethylase AlkB [Cupriavidus sp. ISTL7]
MTFDLFDNLPEPGSPGGEHSEAIGPGAVVLRGFALSRGSALREAIEQVQAEAPFRHLVTPGGFRMSVAMTNCGTLGWVSDASGYRYDPIDPDSGRPWPAMPAVFTELAREAAAAAGYPGFAPDACLINRYTPGTRLSLHQDRDERDLRAPIVSVSLGLPAVFLFGGPKRADRPARVRLAHGDIAVWGGPSRLFYHGIAPLADGDHPLTGALRLNLTFRKAS